jgi:hypothetical protein
MRSSVAAPGLALALLALPALSGCAELGIGGLTGGADGQAAALAVASSDPGAVPGPDGVPTPPPAPTFFSSPDGYALTLPAGWLGARVSSDQVDGLLSALAAVDRGLARAARSALAASGSRLSMVAGDVASLERGALPAAAMVLVLPTSGVPDDVAGQLVAELISRIRGVGPQVSRSVVTIPAGDATRFDFDVTPAGSIPVAVRCYLFSIGGDALVVAFAAPADVMSDAAPSFEQIIRSLRFGV